MWQIPLMSKYLAAALVIMNTYKFYMIQPKSVINNYWISFGTALILPIQKDNFVIKAISIKQLYFIKINSKKNWLSLAEKNLLMLVDFLTLLRKFYQQRHFIQQKNTIKNIIRKIQYAIIFIAINVGVISVCKHYGINQDEFT